MSLKILLVSLFYIMVTVARPDTKDFEQVFSTSFFRSTWNFLLLEIAINVGTVLWTVLCCICRSSRPKVFLGKGILEICSKCTGEHPCLSVILIKLQSNFIEITIRHGCSPVNLLHIFRSLFLRTLLDGYFCICICNSINVRTALIVISHKYHFKVSFNSFCRISKI